MSGGRNRNKWSEECILSVGFDIKTIGWFRFMKEILVCIVCVV